MSIPSTTSPDQSWSAVQSLCEVYAPDECNPINIALAATVYALSIITFGLFAAAAFAICSLIDSARDISQLEQETSSKNKTSRLSEKIINQQQEELDDEPSSPIMPEATKPQETGREHTPPSESATEKVIRLSNEYQRLSDLQRAAMDNIYHSASESINHLRDEKKAACALIDADTQKSPEDKKSEKRTVYESCKQAIKDVNTEAKKQMEATKAQYKPLLDKISAEQDKDLRDAMAKYG